MPGNNRNAASILKQVAWFCSLWVAGVAIISLTAFLVRILII